MVWVIVNTSSGGRLSRIDKIELIDDYNRCDYIRFNIKFTRTLLRSYSTVNPMIGSLVPTMDSQDSHQEFQVISLKECHCIIYYKYLCSTRFVRFNIKIYVKGCPCSHSCDCRTLIGTGQTGTYYYPALTPLGAYTMTV